MTFMKAGTVKKQKQSLPSVGESSPFKESTTKQNKSLKFLLSNIQMKNHFYPSRKICINFVHMLPFPSIARKVKSIKKRVTQLKGFGFVSLLPPPFPSTSSILRTLAEFCLPQHFPEFAFSTQHHI